MRKDERNMKIGIMGGTFNPIHNGHLILAKFAMEEFDLDKIWFMPNGNPPHKSDYTITASADQRLHMVALAIEEIDGFELQDYEVWKPGIHYSYMTMEYFRKKYPDDSFYFIIGADSLFSLKTWRHPERLLKTCTVLVAYREGKTLLDLKAAIATLNKEFDADIRFFRCPQIDVSSTDIRGKIKESQNIQDLVPKAVYRYIQKNQLFGD